MIPPPARAVDAPTNPDRNPRVVPDAYVTADVPPVGGLIKTRPEDFTVEELPLYEPSGSGEHLYLFIQKRSMSTLELVGLLSRHFNVPRHAVGYAGLKDKHAVTRQLLSVHTPGKKLEDFPSIRSDRVEVLWADRHENKLRPGHLRGNHFSVRIRGAPVQHVLAAQRALHALAERGVPNRLGEQRFGLAQNNHLVGRALLLGDHRAALDELLGPVPGLADASRDHYARADYAAARDALPLGARSERMVLQRLLAGATPEQALRAIDPAERAFFLTAFQSAVFNTLLDQRVAAGTLGVLEPGDVAMKAHSRAMFDVTPHVASDPDTRQRLDAFEISPSGAMWGPSMKRAEAEEGRRETHALAAYAVTPDDIAHYAKRPRPELEGTRRPYRVRLTEPLAEAGGDEHGSYIRVAFELPRGAFATVVLRELIKPTGPSIEAPHARSNPPDTPPQPEPAGSACSARAERPDADPATCPLAHAH